MRTRVVRAVVVACLTSTTVAVAQPEAAEAPEPPKRSERTVDVGVLGGVGFPRPFAIEPVVRVGRSLMLGAEYGFLPTTTVASVDVRMWAASADVRVFPLGGAFFVGLRGGYQRITGEATLTAQNVGSYTESVAVGSWYVNPRIGFLWVWKPFALGLDAGVQLPVSTSVSRSSLLAVAAPEVDARITSATNALGRTVLPTVDLLRIGLVF